MTAKTSALLCAAALLAAHAEASVPPGSTEARLFEATAQGRGVEIRRLLADGVDVHARNRGGETPLHHAASGEAAMLLLDAGAYADARDRWGRTPLHHAVLGNRTEAVQLILGAGASVAARDIDGNTALRLAVVGDRLELARLILDAGADLTAPNSEFISALDIAWAKGEEFMRRLLGGSADLWIARAEAGGKRFELYNGCGPMGVLASLGHEGDKRAPGIGEDAIRDEAESRLRAAGLHDSSAEGQLAVRVSLAPSRADWAYRADVRFERPVWGIASDQRSLAATWELGFVGTASNHSTGEAILEDIGRGVDQFLAEYLRVNREACELNRAARRRAQ